MPVAHNTFQIKLIKKKNQSQGSKHHTTDSSNKHFGILLLFYCSIFMAIILVGKTHLMKV